MAKKVRRFSALDYTNSTVETNKQLTANDLAKHRCLRSIDGVFAGASGYSEARYDAHRRFASREAVQREQERAREKGRCGPCCFPPSVSLDADVDQHVEDDDDVGLFLL